MVTHFARNANGRDVIFPGHGVELEGSLDGDRMAIGHDVGAALYL